MKRQFRNNITQPIYYGKSDDSSIMNDSQIEKEGVALKQIQMIHLG